MKRVSLIYITGTCVLLAGNAPAEPNQEAGFLGNMVSQVGEKLDKAESELDTLKPMLDRKRAEMSSAVDQAVDEGIGSLRELTAKAQHSAAELEGELQEILSDPEVQKLADWLANLDEQAVEELYDRITNKFAQELGVTGEQLKELKPIVKGQLRQIGGMLDELVAEGIQRREVLAQRLTEIEGKANQAWKATEEDLADILDAAQIDQAREWFEKVSEKATKLVLARSGDEG